MFREPLCRDGREVWRYGDRQAAHCNDTHPDITKYHQTDQRAPPRGWSQREAEQKGMDHDNGTDGETVDTWIYGTAFITDSGGGIALGISESQSPRVLELGWEFRSHSSRVWVGSARFNLSHSIPRYTSGQDGWIS